MLKKCENILSSSIPLDIQCKHLPFHCTKLMEDITIKPELT